MSNGFDTIVVLLCFSDFTILTTAGRHDMILLDTNGLQKLKISHMFFLPFTCNESLDFLGSIRRYIYLYLFYRITSPAFWAAFGRGFCFCFTAGKKQKSRFGRLLKVSSLKFQGRSFSI